MSKNFLNTSKVLSGKSSYQNHGFFFQPKLTINQPNDTYEVEADAMADKVMRMNMPSNAVQLMPLPISSVQRKCAHCEEEQKMQRKEMNSSETTADAGLESYVGSLNSGGQALSPEARSFYEPRFGYDFSNVKIHVDSVAAKSAQSINALAYTSGNNIVFNSGQYAPNTESGKRLLGHELTHVVQQGSGIAAKRIQRQSIAGISSGKDNLTLLSYEELVQRLETLKRKLDSFTVCSSATLSLVDEITEVEAEINVRDGKTFSSDSIEKLKDYHQKNASKDENADSCIVALNKGVSKLQSRTSKELKTTPETIEKTMEGLSGVGLIDGKIEINFNNKKGKPTTGSSFPATLQSSVWDALFLLSNSDPGWIVFGLSLMDGNHSVTLTLDNNKPSSPKVYWSDQWHSKGGWKEYNRNELDAEVTSLIQGWWNKQAEGKKFNTVIRIWRLKPYK